ncbi:FAD-dependent monooxygenase [Nonomuraea antimicrobica]
MDLQCRAGDDPAALAADPRSWLRPLLPSGHACEIIWSSHYLFRQAVAQTFTVGRVLLAGEAAHLFAPFGARGSTPASPTRPRRSAPSPSPLPARTRSPATTGCDGPPPSATAPPRGWRWRT